MYTDKRFKILVVDDERSNIDALTYILKPKYTVLVVKDGQSALDVAHKSMPDIILLDVVMPGMNGFETLTQLKASDVTRGIPVIFITGRDNAADEEKGFALGAADYITKPFHDSVVKARVSTHLQMAEYIRTIERLGMIDELTNLPNRRSFNIRLKMEWERAIRNKTPISILIIDVDKFKLFNDRHGHANGDVLLGYLAEIFQQSMLRPGDFVARWGGEEFVLLLPQTELEGAVDVAERVRSNVERLSPTFACCLDGELVTVSVGVNTESPDLDSPIDDFFSGADKALYDAKEQGRNKVCANIEG